MYARSTGCGGLILGGGIGYLSRRFGLSIDSLLEVELVTAQGEVLRVLADSDAELLCAVEGVGLNFGVITEFVLSVYPVGHVARQLTADDEAIAAKYHLPAQAELKHKLVQGILPYPQPASRASCRCWTSASCCREPRRASG